MSMSELLKEAKLTQDNLESSGMGLLPIVLHTDTNVARAQALLVTGETAERKLQCEAS